MCGADSQQQMNVVRDAADGFWDHVDRFCGAAKVGMQAWTPRELD